MDETQLLHILNNGSQDELTALPGIGTALAERILVARPFETLEKVQTVKGIGKNLLEQLTLNPCSQSDERQITMAAEPNETTPSKSDAAPNKPESASPTLESGQSVPESGQATAESSPVQAEKPEIGRFQGTLRIALIALVAVIIVFLTGFLTDHFARYSPMKTELTAQLAQTQDDLTQANQTISDLQSQMDNLTAQLTAANDRIAALEQNKENLQADLDSANVHIELLTVLAELKTAHIELKSDNIAGAKVVLSNTAARLENLKPLVETVDSNLAANMLTRLSLILASIDTDSATAQADLGLLAKNLQSVETLLFGKK